MRSARHRRKSNRLVRLPGKDQTTGSSRSEMAFSRPRSGRSDKLRLTAVQMAGEWSDDLEGYAWDYGLSSINQQAEIWLDISLSAYDDEPLWVHGN